MATSKAARAAGARAAELRREMDRARAESERLDEQMEKLKRETRESVRRQRQQWQPQMRMILDEALEPLMARRGADAVGRGVTRATGPRADAARWPGGGGGPEQQGRARPMRTGNGGRGGRADSCLAAASAGPGDGP